MSRLAQQSMMMAAILDLSRLVCASLDLDEVLSRIIVVARDLSGAEIVSIMLLDEPGQHLTIAASHGIDPQVCKGLVLALGEGVAGWVALHGEPLQLIDPRSDPRYLTIISDEQANIFSLPLRAQDRTLGVINLARKASRALFDPVVCQMVEIFASHAAIAIANAAAATALRFAAARERMISLVSLAPRTTEVAPALIDQILAEVGAALEVGYCALLMLPSEGDRSAAGWSVAAGWPAGLALPSGWAPGDAGRLQGEQMGPAGCQIYAALPDRSAGADWLLAGVDRPDRYWRRADHELLRFAAGQIALVQANRRLISAEQRSRALSATMSQLATACNAMIGRERVLDFILEQLARFIDYDSSGVFVFHNDEYARMVAGRGFRFANRPVVLYMGPDAPSWMPQHAGQAVYIPDVQQVADWQSVPDSDIVRAWIGVPLTVNDAVIGLLTIDKWSPQAFLPDDVQVAQMFADHLSVAIYNARLLREAQTKASQIAALHELSVGLSAIREVQPLLDEVAGLLHRAFGYYQVGVAMVEGGQIVFRAARGRVNDVADFGPDISYSTQRGLTGWVVRHGQTALVNDVAQDARYIAAPHLNDACSELVVPIKHGDEVIGIIDIESNLNGSFTQSDVYLAESLAGQTAVALQNILRYEELRRTQEHLLHSERLRALGELSSGVAHDFNNLLASILGHTQLLIADGPPPAISEGLQIIERAAHDGAATVRRLQRFAQTSRTLPDEEVSLNEIIAESLAITRPRWRDELQSQGLQLAIVRDLGDLPPLVGDGPALRDLVTNLILNALDAMPAGGQLRLRSALLTDEGPPSRQTALVEVADTGVGMSAEVQQRIFDPFFSTKGERGMGMGLAMAYGIIQRHQGQIQVTSAPGAGTTFTVRLPVRRLARTEATLAPAGAPAPAQPLRILVVEDDESVLRVLTQLLTRLGHTVSSAASGHRALEHLEVAPVDLLCSDLGMPEMSGWDLVAQARARHPQLLTLLVTGWGDQISPEEARRNGVDGVIAKPFDIARLRQAIGGLQSQAQLRLPPARGAAL